VAVGSVFYVRLPPPQRRVCSCHMMTGTLPNKLDQAICLCVVCGRRTFRIYTLVPSIMTENFRSFSYSSRILPGECFERHYFFSNFLILKILGHQSCVIYQREPTSKGHIYLVSNFLLRSC